jgi:hypothetical protein
MSAAPGIPQPENAKEPVQIADAAERGPYEWFTLGVL